MKSVLISNRPKWCGKICHEIGKDENGKPIYEKTIEVRKERPSEVPFRCLIYATNPKKWYKSGPLLISDESLWLVNGKVKMCDGLELWADSAENYHCLNGKIIGEFICDRVEEFHEWQLSPQGKFQEAEQHDLDVFLRESCLTIKEVAEYRKNLPYYKPLYCWQISDLKIYDKPKELSEFRKSGFMTEEEWLFNLYPNTHCHYDAWAKKFEITRPPQSYMFVREIETR